MKNLSVVSQALEAKLKALFGEDNVEYDKDESEKYSDENGNYLIFDITKTFEIEGDGDYDDEYGMEIDFELSHPDEVRLVSYGDAVDHVMKEIDDKIEGFTTTDGDVIEAVDEDVYLTKFYYAPEVMYYSNGDPGHPAECDYAFAGEVTIKFSITIREDD